MKVAIYSIKEYEKQFLEAANTLYHHDLVYFDAPLNENTALLSQGFLVVSCFVSDDINAKVVKKLTAQGVKLIALRSAGFNNVDLDAAKKFGLKVVRVPIYSPYAVAEFTVGLILNLNRKIHRAYYLVKEHNFLLTGLLGFDLHGKTLGIIGTGNIGTAFAHIMHGFGCKIFAYDPLQNDECKQLGVQYISLDELFQQSAIISLHCPLTPETHHIINDTAISKMQDGVMLINTGRGGLIDTLAAIKGLKSQKIGFLGIDVYEEEANLFFKDLSNTIIQDEVFSRLQSFPNVVITGHQAFFTREAITGISNTTLLNITTFENTPNALINEVIQGH